MCAYALSPYLLTIAVRISAILLQAETLRERVPAGASSAELYPVQRIQEECAEVIQLLVTLSGDD